MNTTMSRDFLARCFAPGETIAILLRREQPARIVQRIVRIEQATAPAYLRWLAHENAQSMNVYVAANPLRLGSRKRTKECVAEVRHLYIDIDREGESTLEAIRAASDIPQPSAIVSTSPGKYQVLWKVTGFSIEEQELMLKCLAWTFGSDPACTDCNRVVRLPGFRNNKYAPPYPVTVEYGSDGVSSPVDFSLRDAYGGFMPPPLEIAPPLSSAGKPSNSECDWAWALSELARGKDAVKLTRELAARRADKPNPLYYAERTVDVASAYVAMSDGTPIHDVIIEIEERRRSEFPHTLASARAREIAQTAARSIARKRIA